MLKVIIVFLLMLVVINPSLAVEGPGNTPRTTLAETESRYLSAEAQRLIRDEMDTVQEELKNYQDENFIALDGQMREVIGQAQQKIVLGALGAVLLGGAAVAFFMFHIAKKYSYETFLQKHVADGTFTEERPQFPEEERGLNEMYQDPNLQELQQADWGTQGYGNTVSSDYGQSFASNNSEFSSWQDEATYPGGWKWDRK